MTLSEFNQYNKTKSMPREWIGQGWGYKVEEWNSDDDIIYIPEYGYEEDGEVLRGNAYSFNDLIEIVITETDVSKDKARKIAMTLFNVIDWQFPEGVLQEVWFECEEV